MRHMKKKNRFLVLVLATVVAGVTPVVILVQSGCKKEVMLARLPKVATTQVYDVTETSASCSGNVTYDGGAFITERGVCWNQGGTPTIADSKAAGGEGSGAFIGTMEGLSPNTFYCARAYATNSAGTSYGEVMSFHTFFETVTDIDSNTYYTVVIGNREWMAENLRTTKFNDGKDIPQEETFDWSSITVPVYAVPKYVPDFRETYGALYNGYAALSGKLCPKGWHLPAETEWQTLVTFLGDSIVAGGKMKESGSAHWGGQDPDNTNESGFTALPAGWIRTEGGGGGGCKETGINGFGMATAWWSDTRVNDTVIYIHAVTAASSQVYYWFSYANEGNSVRCIRDN
jgi:uncharacterized protein (TIGR02145 family)